VKLYKILINPENEFPSEPELIMTSDDRDYLKRRAEAMARATYGIIEFIWVFEGNDKDYTELNIDNQCKFVVRSW